MNEKALDEANDVLFFDEIPTVSFEKGTEVSGIILAVERQQQREFREAGNGPAMYWDREETRPIWQVMVTLQTAELDPDDESDDGRRRIYLKGRAKANPESTQDAVRDAVKARKRKRIEVGAWMRLECYNETTPPNPKMSGTKLYRAWYREVGAPVPTMAEMAGLATVAPAKKSATAK